MSIKILKCPRCGYYGKVNCAGSLRSVGSGCKCPECGYVISQRRRP